MNRIFNKKPLCIVFIFISLFFGQKTIVFAQHFQSNSYIIDWGNFNITSGNKSSGNYKLTDTVGQNAPGQYDSGSYTVKSGFQYVYDNQIPFTFSINSLKISFGSLVPQIGTTAANTITVSTPSGHGYQIMAVANHPLKNDVGATIPNVACDGASPCTISSSGTWADTTTYGFGFNALGVNSSGTVTGVGTSSYFASAAYFRPFANAAASPADPPQIIMADSLPTKSQSARITYKINISSSQQSGHYQNGIIFIAVPKY